MAIHAFDNNGVIVGQIGNGATDHVIFWEQKGLHVVTNAKRIDRLDFWYYINDTLTEKTQEEKDIILQAEADALIAKQQAQERKRQDFIDNYPDWHTVKVELETIGTAIDALSQPYKGILKDMLARMKKDAKVINWLLNNSD